MTAYFDTSAVVRLYLDEGEHEQVRAMAAPILTTELTRVEVSSAVWKKARMEHITTELATALDGLIAFDLEQSDSRFALIPPDGAVLRSACEAVRRHGLRAYDAVQLATALVARASVPELTTFVTFDRGLRAAAAAEGFAVEPALD